MSRRRKQLEAWARMRADGSGCALSWYKDECDDYGAGTEGMRTVRLVEYSQVEAALVRTAVREATNCPESNCTSAVCRAAKRLVKESKRKGDK